MKQQIAHISLLVKDYDEALDFYLGKLKFKLLEDTKQDELKRWVVISPGDSGCSLLLARAANEEQLSRVGNQSGGRVFLFLHTSDLESYYQLLLDNKVKIVREPAEEIWGTVAVFADLYGNLWDLVEPKHI